MTLEQYIARKLEHLGRSACLDSSLFVDIKLVLSSRNKKDPPVRKPGLDR